MGVQKYGVHRGPMLAMVAGLVRWRRAGLVAGAGLGEVFGHQSVAATDSSWSVAASGGSRMRNHGLCKVSVGVLHIDV
jgi:hypothetical protein